MNISTLTDFGYQTAKNTVGIMAVNMVGIPTQMKKVAPNLPGMGYALNGVTYGLAVDAVRAVEGGSKLVNGQYISLFDDMGFLGVFSAGLDLTGADKAVFDAVKQFSPLSHDMNINLTEGALVSGGLAVANILDKATGENKLFDFIRRPVSESMKMLSA